MRDEFHPFFDSYPSILKFKCIRRMHRTIKILSIKKKKVGGALMLRESMEICFSFSSFFFPCFILQCLSPQMILEQWWQWQQSDPVGPFTLKEENLPLQTKEPWSENNGRSPSYLPYSLPFSQVPPSPPLSSLLPPWPWCGWSQGKQAAEPDVLRQEVFLWPEDCKKMESEGTRMYHRDSRERI